jgi:hypothetical protein
MYQRKRAEKLSAGIASRIAQLQLDQVSRRPGEIPVSLSKEAKRDRELGGNLRHVKELKCLDNDGNAMRSGVNKSSLTLRFEKFQQRKLQESKNTIETSPFPERSPLLDGRTELKKRIPPPPPSQATKQLIPSLISTGAEATPPPLPPRLAPPKNPVLPKTSLTIIPPVVSEYHCLRCRDFSAVDAHASKFPRDQVTSISQLSRHLTSPFSNKTDKARAIFVWLHHNIIYNTEAFFSGNLKPSTPSSTLSSGLAVCEGYAGLFSELAAQAEIEAKVVSGYGKGFGFISPTRGKVPEFESNHAWNMVKLDSQEWHLIDSCWGAGHVSSDKRWVTTFNPRYFCSSAEEFGRDHFPQDQEMQLRQSPRLWEEFILTPEGPIISSNCVFEINQNTLLPGEKRIYIGLHEFVVEPICFENGKADYKLMVSSPSGKWTRMRKESKGGWHCSVNVEEKGSWWCCRAIEPEVEGRAQNSTQREWDPYRYGWEGLCGWECG